MSTVNTFNFIRSLSNHNGLANLDMPGFTVPVRVESVDTHPFDGVQFTCRAVSNIVSKAAPKTGAKPVRVIFNPPATIVFWSDNTKTVVKCSEDDEFDQTMGLAMAICKKMYGNNSCYNDIFRQFVTKGTAHKNIAAPAMDRVDPVIGDYTYFELDGFGTVMATVQKVTDDEIIYMTDDCIMEAPMNDTSTNAGGYDASVLKRKIESDLLSRFPKELRERITFIAPPTYGQIFGHDEWYHQAIEPDNDEQFELMKKRKNRVADYKDDYSWYWLRNATKKNYSASTFAYVRSYGGANFYDASHSSGVRVVFHVKK